MKKVLMLLSAITVVSVVIQQIISGTGRKHIRSRADDPSIPPISTRSF